MVFSFPGTFTILKKPWKRSFDLSQLQVDRVPTFTGKPGKMRVHLENLEKSWNFAKNNKNHGKITWNLEKYLGRL